MMGAIRPPSQHVFQAFAGDVLRFSTWTCVLGALAHIAFRATCFCGFPVMLDISECLKPHAPAFSRFEFESPCGTDAGVDSIFLLPAGQTMSASQPTTQPVSQPTRHPGQSAREFSRELHGVYKKFLTMYTKHSGQEQMHTLQPVYQKHRFPRENLTGV